MASKGFTGNTPRNGRQRSAQQVTARLQDLLNYINEIFVLTDNVLNYGKVIGFNSVTGAVEAVSVLKYSGSKPLNNGLIFDASGNLIPAFAVTGTNKRYNIGPDGTNGQIASTDGSGNITFVNPPASTAFINQSGNFTVTPSINYNIDAGAQITILTANVVAGFQFSVRPKYGQNFSSNPPRLLYNGVNLYENLAEFLDLDLNGEYLFYSTNGTNIEFSVKGVSENV